MRVTFGTLKIGETAKRNLGQVIETNWASAGPLVKQFENNWNEKFGYADSVSMSSGTDADINACLALYDRGAKRDDEVICPALTFVATINAVLMAGFMPTFADIDRNTLNIDPQKIEDAITDKTRAIMVTHTMGKPCDMDAIMSIANDRDLFVIEDGCMPGDQKIITSKGIKPINEISTDDLVLTHRGRFSPVTETMRRHYKGEMCQFYTYGGHFKLDTTPEHPIFCCKTRNIQISREKTWHKARDVNRGDYLVFPRYKIVVQKDAVDLDQYPAFCDNSKYKTLFAKRYKKNMPVNDYLMKIIGWYLAEGYSEKQHVTFSLGKHETNHIETLVESCDHLGLDCEVQNRKSNQSVSCVCLFSKQMKYWLAENFGNGALNKKIPKWVLDLPAEQLEVLLHAYINGDGNKVKNRESQYSCCSISLNLLLSIRIICSKLGYFSGISKIASKGESIILGRKVNINDKYQLRFSTERLNKLDRRVYVDDDYIYVRVKNATRYKHDGNVYNFAVEKDNSYCGLGWIVHNCEAHGAQYKGKHIGKFGHVVTFSYYVAHIVVCGEGGMCSTQYSEVADMLRSTKSHGRKPGSTYFDFLRIGINSKMNDLEASIGLEGLEQFDSTIANRVKNRSRLMKALEGLQDEIWLPNLGSGDEFVSPHAFPLVFKKDNPDRCSKFYKFLEDNSIQCKTLFGSMPTQHDAFKALGYQLGDFPEAEFVGNNGVHFGIHQYLTEEDIDYVSNRIHDFIG